MLKIELRKIDESTALELIELSRVWAEEACSWGIVPNCRTDLSEPLIVALDGERIVGYLFGHFYEQERQTSYMEKGKRCFSLDEFYVFPQYRGCGIGTNLYRAMEKYLHGKCAYLTLTTPTKDYKSIMKLYIDEFDMEFISAFLIKNMEESTCES